MSWIIFSNPGELDIRALTTMGVNAKPNSDSPIGYFGTGLKYAIATALRLDCKIVISSGLRQFHFARQPQTIRGKEFSLVAMVEAGGGSRTLDWTTELGKNWEPWMVARELWSNMRDEGGEVSISAALPPPQADQTIVAVSGKALAQAWAERESWLIEASAKPRWENDSLQAFIAREPQTGFFYQGIKVNKNVSGLRYRWNIKKWIPLSEDRQADSYVISQIMAKELAQRCEDEALLREIILAGGECAEGKLDWSWAYDPSEAFVKTVEGLIDGHLGKIPVGVIELCRGKIARRKPKAVPMTAVEAKMMQRALGFLAKLGHEVDQEIVVVDSLGSQWLAGLAADGVIFLPKAAFGKGTKFIASTLLEEHLHITKHLRDESRELQDWLFDRVVSLGEELMGEPL